MVSDGKEEGEEGMDLSSWGWLELAWLAGLVVVRRVSEGA